VLVLIAAFCDSQECSVGDEIPLHSSPSLTLWFFFFYDPDHIRRDGRIDLNCFFPIYRHVCYSSSTNAVSLVRSLPLISQEILDISSFYRQVFGILPRVSAPPFFSVLVRDRTGNVPPKRCPPSPPEGAFLSLLAVVMT